MSARALQAEPVVVRERTLDRLALLLDGVEKIGDGRHR